MPFIGRTSITIPSSLVDIPATECPPARIDSSMPACCTSASAEAISSASAHCTITAGRRSIIPLCRERASSYRGSSGPSLVTRSPFPPAVEHLNEHAPEQAKPTTPANPHGRAGLIGRAAAAADRTDLAGETTGRCVGWAGLEPATEGL